MTRRNRPTDDAVKLVRGLSGTHKLILAIGALIVALYSGITFVAGIEYEKREKARQKIGREEFKNYKAEVKETLRAIEAKLEKLDDRLDKAEAGR